MRHRLAFWGLHLASVSLILGCVHHRAPDIALDELVPAKAVPEAPPPMSLIEVPQALPLPGQLKLTPSLAEPSNPENPDPKTRITKANKAARVEPSTSTFVNATQLWPFTEGSLYQIYSSPERVTDIALEAGEELTSVSAGDTVRWVIGDTQSGSGSDQHVHILVKPTRTDLHTNLVINTSRRTYHLELTSTDKTWMASVSFEYPYERLMALKATSSQASRGAPIAQDISLDRLKFRYAISGDSPSWRPVRAFDDGAKVYIEFPQGIGQGEMPPLFVDGPGGGELVNYRVHSPYYIVDRLFARAELRLGGPQAQVVRIARTDAKPASSSGK
jgi:type IV secretion system protein TrbG